MTNERNLEKKNPNSENPFVCIKKTAISVWVIFLVYENQKLEIIVKIKKKTALFENLYCWMGWHFEEFVTVGMNPTAGSTVTRRCLQPAKYSKFHKKKYIFMFQLLQ